VLGVDLGSLFVIWTSNEEDEQDMKYRREKTVYIQSANMPNGGVFLRTNGFCLAPVPHVSILTSNHVRIGF
jgi:hypothetical protein